MKVVIDFKTLELLAKIDKENNQILDANNKFIGKYEIIRRKSGHFICSKCLWDYNELYLLNELDDIEDNEWVCFNCYYKEKERKYKNIKYILVDLDRDSFFYYDLKQWVKNTNTYIILITKDSRMLERIGGNHIYGISYNPFKINKKKVISIILNTINENPEFRYNEMKQLIYKKLEGD